MSTSKIHQISHPLLKTQIANLRLASTNSKEFRSLVANISTISAVEATREWDCKLVEGQGPLAEFEGEALKVRFKVFVPYLSLVMVC